jgi:hypothetical protein
MAHYKRLLVLRSGEAAQPMPQQESQFLVSVILTEGHDIKMLDRAVGSVLQQTFTDWELLVVGSGSVARKRGQNYFPLAEEGKTE